VSPSKVNRASPWIRHRDGKRFLESWRETTTFDPCTILMIGGDIVDRRMLNDMLARSRGLSCALVTADTIDGGLRCLGGGGIDLVIADLSGRGENRLQALRRLGEEASHIPILVLDDRDDPQLAIEAIREGAEDYLVKDHIHAAMLERVICTTLERRAFRQTRQQHRSRQNTLIADNADAMVVVSLNGMVRFVNPAAEEMFHRKLEALIGTPFGCPITGAGRTEVDILRPDGRTTVSEMHVVVAAWGDEKVYLATLRDITERKATETALRQYERIFRSSSDAIAVIDLNGGVAMANRSFNHWFRSKNHSGGAVKLPEVLDKSFYEESIRPGLRRCALGKQNQLQAWMTLTDGRQKYTTMTFDPLHDEDAITTACIWTIRDLSETKTLEKQLRQSQKMEAIGTLAGGIAHNFNNLLMGIQGRSSLMLLDTAEYDPFREHLHGIEALVKEASGLTKQLLGYARGGKYDPVPTDVNALVSKNLHMFASTRKEIEIVENYALDMWRVEVDRSQVSQVLLNIFVNAAQAMPDGGRLTVKTTNVKLSSRSADACGVAEGRYVAIHVSDTGRGMARGTLQRIFDPFYTTKGPGRGTGLGLASAYGIVRNHNGFIDVDSEIGEGACFSIYLPATDKAILSHNGVRHRVVKGSETLLLVDDEIDVLEIGRQLLRRLGYTVKAVSSGAEALQIYEAHPAAIDLVLLDMVMPGMGGGETFDRLRQINPAVKVLLASGYSLEGQAEQILARGCDGFIQKPFDISALSAKLRSLLDP